MAFSELIKDFGKIRDYMRDFYIYGFKGRNDFSKSPRTYDDERRRIENYLDSYVKWKTDRRGKSVYLSFDTGEISINPLYNAWKAKSFTDNDITLHFAILSVLSSGEKNIAQLTDEICKLTGSVYDSQTIRIKANEYTTEGLLVKERMGRSDYYSLSNENFYSLLSSRDGLLKAVKFFQAAGFFGFIGSTILDDQDEGNDLFKLKHYYIVHTLEDGILLDALYAIEEKKEIEFKLQSSRNSREHTIRAVPLVIFVSSQTGRRFLCVYSEKLKRFQNHRLDSIKNIRQMGKYENYDDIKNKLLSVKEKCWGVSFGGRSRSEELKMKLHIDEKREMYVIDRLKREGRGGVITRISENTYEYSNTIFDMGEMMAWVKTFTGRIISLEGTNKKAIQTFYSDMKRMHDMYFPEESNSIIADKTIPNEQEEPKSITDNNTLFNEINGNILREESEDKGKR